MNLTKQQVIERFCKLAALVGSGNFNHQIPHDCFCVQGDGKFCDMFQFDENIISYIEKSVEEKMYNDEENL